ncbi:MAG: glutathione peroxidase [Ferruginibacter sp.]
MNSQMTIRQKFLKAVYPVFMWLNKMNGGEQSMLSNSKASPAVPFYSLEDTANSGQEFDFASLKGKKVLLVNTASDCGFTGQYDDLEKLHQKYQGKLVVLGFPSNDFKEQEKGSDEEIAEFCKINFGVTFPLMKKSTVKKGTTQNKIFKWLSDPQQNGWNKRQAVWNFSKYLVDENGKLVNYFGPAISPMDEMVLKAIEGDRYTDDTDEMDFADKAY